MVATVFTYFAWTEMLWTLQILTIFTYFFLKNSDRTGLVQQRLDAFKPKLIFILVGVVWLLLGMLVGIIGYGRDGTLHYSPNQKAGLLGKLFMPLCCMFWFMVIMPIGRDRICLNTAVEYVFLIMFSLCLVASFICTIIGAAAGSH